MAESVPARSQPKPPRLKAACNNCNAAKVKCSGERSGCNRCTDMLADCIYTESRTGKVQGVRSKRTRSQIALSNASTSVTSVAPSSIASTNSQTIADNDNGEPAVSRAQSPPHAPQSSTASIEQALQSWEPEPWTTGSWEDGLGPFNGSLEPLDFGDLGEGTNNESISSRETVDNTMSIFGTNSSESSHTDDSSVSARDVQRPLPSSSLASGRNGPALPTPSSIPSLPSSRITSMPPPRIGIRRPDAKKTRLDGRCVLTASQMIITLENYILSDLKALELILRAVRQATDDLHQLVQHQQTSRSDRCIFLFFTIMYQIVELLEAGARSLDDDVNDGLESMMALGQPPFPTGFGFSSFSMSMGAEDQRLWKAHILRREYQRTTEILNSVGSLATMGPGDAPLAPADREHRSKCMTELGRRFKQLCENIEKC